MPNSISLGAELRSETSLSSDQHAVADLLLTYIAQPYVTIVPNNTGFGHQAETVCHSHIVFNNGTISDTVNLTAIHSPWSDPDLALYEDVNGNGAYEAGTDALLVDTNGDLITDTDVIEADSFVRILACLTIPESVEDDSSNVTTIRATSTVSDTHFSEATDTTTVLVGPGLAMTKSQTAVAGEPLYPGDEITYTIVVTNLDTIIHTNLIITDIAGPSLFFVPGSGIIEPGGGGITVATLALTATCPALGLNQTITVTFRAKLSINMNPGDVTNVAYADSDQQDTPISASSSGTVEAGLDIEKTAEDLNGEPLYVGDLIRYHITITNNVAISMTSVVITDTLPAGVDFISATPSGYAGPNPLVWNVGTLGIGATWTAAITVEVDGTADPIGGNVAAVSSDQQDEHETDPVLPPGGGDVEPGTGSPCTCPPDTHEPDDGPTQAGSPIVGSGQPHDFCDDYADWVTLPAQAGDVFTITTSSWGQRADTFLALVDADGHTLLAANDDYAGATDYSSRIIWQAPSNDVYYVRVTNQAGLTGCNTDYDILVEHQEIPTMYLPLVMRNHSAATVAESDIALSPGKRVPGTEATNITTAGEPDAVLRLTGIISHTCPDEYDQPLPDDTWEDAKPIEIGSVQAHSFDSNPEFYAADKDYVWFDVLESHISFGETVTVTITTVTNTQTLMQLHDVHGGALDVTGTFTTPLVWTPGAAGRYYLSVSPEGGITTFDDCATNEAGYNLLLVMEEVETLYLPLAMRDS